MCAYVKPVCTAEVETVLSGTDMAGAVVTRRIKALHPSFRGCPSATETDTRATKVLKRHSYTNTHSFNFSLTTTIAGRCESVREAQTGERARESAKGRRGELWPVFCDHVEADRERIGYHSLTPNTFTADTMINESGVALQGLFLDPLEPPHLPTPLHYPTNVELPI